MKFPGSVFEHASYYMVQ